MLSDYIVQLRPKGFFSGLVIGESSTWLGAYTEKMVIGWGLSINSEFTDPGGNVQENSLHEVEEKQTSQLHDV